MNLKIILGILFFLGVFLYIFPNQNEQKSSINRKYSNGPGNEKQYDPNRKKAFVFQLNKEMNRRISSYFKNNPEQWELLDNSNKKNIEKADLIWKGKQKDYVFKENQWWNHSPLQRHMNNKGHVVTMFRDYSKKINNAIEYTEILPETYRFNLNSRSFSAEEKEFFKNPRNREIVWISKPMGGRRGNGISIVNDLDKFYEDIKFQKEQGNSGIDSSSTGEDTDHQQYSEKLIVQKYIQNPFLIDGKKFDIRCYLYISSYEPFVSFYYPGYLRKSIYDYNQNDYSNMLSHLVNVSLQKEDPNYKTEAPDSLWMMEQFKEYILKNGKYTINDYDNFEKKILKLLTFVSEAFYNLQMKSGADSKNRYQIYGADIAVDENLNPYILEVNIDPQLDNPHEEVEKQQLRMLEACQSFQGSVLDQQNNLTQFYQTIDDNYLKRQKNMQQNLILLFNSVSGYSFNYDLINQANNNKREDNEEL